MVHRATARERHEAESRTCLVAILAGGRVVFLVQRFLWPGAIGEIRRRRLVPAGWLRERFPCRFALERRGLGFIAAEQAAEAAAIAELRGAQDGVGAGIAAGLINRIAAGGRLFRRPLVEFARHQE